jgi:hypothetical protein
MLSAQKFHSSYSVLGYYSTETSRGQDLQNAFLATKKRLLNGSLQSNTVLDSLIGNGFWLSTKSDCSVKSIALGDTRDLYVDELHSNNSFMCPLHEGEILRGWRFLDQFPDAKESISAYFGGEDIVIYEASHFLQRRIVTGEKEPTSGFWHRDPVGTHLKVFICLHSNASCPTTQIVPCPYLSPLAREWEMIRTQKHLTKESPQYRMLDNLISDIGTVTISQDVGSVLIFDTNCIHRGCYEPLISYDYITRESYRHVVQFSIMSKSLYALYSEYNGCLYPYGIQNITQDLLREVPLATPPFQP